MATKTADALGSSLLADAPEVDSPESSKEQLLEYVRQQVDNGFATGCARLGLMFENVNYTKEDKVVLKDLTGCIRLGKMVAVIGGANSGASTLIDVLAGRQVGGVLHGDVLVDGTRTVPDPAVSHVPLEPTLIPYLTVHETLNFALKMRVPHPRFTPEMRHFRIALGLKLFELAHRTDTLVGDDSIKGITSSEVRRLSVLLELICGHSFCLANTPTTGLDPASALRMLQPIRTLTESKHFSFIASIKQPTTDILTLFDDVLLLSEGQMIFYGPVSEVVGHFRRVGFECPPSKVMPEFLEGMTIEPSSYEVNTATADSALVTTLLVRQYAKSEYSANMQQALDEVSALVDTQSEAGLEVPAAAASHTARRRLLRTGRPQSVSQASTGRASISANRMLARVLMFGMAPFPTQVLECIKIDLKGNSRYPFEIMARFVRLTIFALLLGIMYFDLGDGQDAARYAPGFFFFTGPVFMFGQAFIIISFNKKRPIYYKQRQDGYYSSVAYMLAMIISHVPAAIFEAVLYTIIAFPMIGFETDNRFFFTMVNTVVSLTGAALCVLAAALTKRVSTAISSMVPLVGLSLLLSGFFQNVDDMNVVIKPFSYISLIRNSWRALMLNDLEGRVFTCDPEEAIGTPCPACLPDHVVPEECRPIPEYLRTNGYYGCRTNTGEEVLDRYSIEGDKGDFLLLQLLFVCVLYALAFLAFHFIRHERAHPVGSQQYEHHTREHSMRLSSTRGSRILNRLDISCRQPFATYLTFKDVGCQRVVSTTFTQRLFGKGETVPVLQGVTGYLKPGELVALVGPDGSGKSTLLDLLVGDRRNVTHVTGDVRVNMHPFGRTWHRFVGYVRQEDSHLGTQTIREAITFSAMLRNDDLTLFEKLAWIEMVIDQVGLRHVEHELIGTTAEGSLAVSAAIRKKVSIAVELAMNPSMLFLDEPTIGFDFTSATAIMTVLRSLADNGAGVMISMSQPTSETFGLVDRVIVLSNGNVIYQGPRSDMLQYCEMSDVLNFRSGLKSLETANAVQRFEKSDYYKKVLREVENGGAPEGVSLRVPIASVFAAPLSQQIKALTTRFGTFFLRSRTIAKTRVVTVAGLAGVLGFMLYNPPDDEEGINARLSLILGMMIASTFTAAGLIPVIVEEKPSFVRETNSKIYRYLTYYVSRLIAELPLLVIAAAIFTVIVYPAVGLQSSRVVSFLLGFLVLQLCVATMTYVSATVSPSAEFGITLYLFFVLLVLVNGGYMVPRDDISPVLLPLHYLDYITYVFAFFLSLEFEGSEFECSTPLTVLNIQPDNPDCDGQVDDECCYKTVPCLTMEQTPIMISGATFADDQYDIDVDNVWNYFALMVLMFFCMGFVSLLALRAAHFRRG